MREDNENREEVDKATNKMRGAHKALDESAVCGQKSRQKCGLRTRKSAKVRVAHKAIDYGVTPERRFGQEAYNKKAVNLVKKQVKKDIRDLA